MENEINNNLTITANVYPLKNARENLLCTNIATNEAAEDKITFWIDGCLYQVKRTPGSSEHEIVRID